MRLALTLTAALVPLAALAAPVPQGPKNVPEFKPAFANQTRAPERHSGTALEVTTVASGLSHPWGLAVLPGGAILVTERAGRLRVIGPDGTLRKAPVAGLPPVAAKDQGGLLDVAISPDFASTRRIFWTYSKPVPGGLYATAAASGTLAPDASRVTEVRQIFQQTPPSPTPKHYGSRLAFDGHGHVFVTMGEHFTPAERVNAQDVGRTYGKVVRLNLDGSVPATNPFVRTKGARPEVWTYGHRNVQGIAVRPGSGQVWELEHGPKGGDELNLLRAGANYGWPVISYGENYNGSPVGRGITAKPGMEQPVYYWDPVIAPGGMTFYDGAMFPAWRGNILIGSLNPGGLQRVVLQGTRVAGEERLLANQGRIRTAAVARDGSVLVLTDRAGGSVLRITPARTN